MKNIAIFLGGTVFGAVALIIWSISSVPTSVHHTTGTNVSQVQTPKESRYDLSFRVTGIVSERLTRDNKSQCESMFTDYRQVADCQIEFSKSKARDFLFRSEAMKECYKQTDDEENAKDCAEVASRFGD